MESTLSRPPWWKVSLSLSKSNDLDLNHSSRCRTEIYQSTSQSIFSSLLEVEILQSSGSKLPGGECFIYKFCNQKILASHWHLLYMQNQRGWSWTNSWKFCWQVKCLHSELFWSVFSRIRAEYSLGYKENFRSLIFISSRVPGPCWPISFSFSIHSSRESLWMLFSSINEKMILAFKKTVYFVSNLQNFLAVINFLI